MMIIIIIIIPIKIIIIIMKNKYTTVKKIMNDYDHSYYAI